MCTNWRIKFSVAIFSPFNYYKERTAHVRYNTTWCVRLLSFVYSALKLWVDACSFKTMQVNMRT